MPELPEVQTVVTSLTPRVTGARILSVRLNRTDILTPPTLDLPPLLIHRTITAIARRAKRIVFTLDDGNQFYIHLGMTGQLTLNPPTADLKAHTHLVLTLAPHAPPLKIPVSGRTEGARSSSTHTQNSVELRFRDPRRFGGLFWLGSTPADHNLGPEPLTLRPARLAVALARTRRPIKSALLDQAVVAGIGNIYADESLFLARIHPLRPANALTPAEIARLNRAIKLTLRRAIRARGSTLRDFVNADNQPGGYRTQHKVYDREGHPCPTCRTTPIRRIVLTGRSTCFCPHCQRAPHVRKPG